MTARAPSAENVVAAVVTLEPEPDVVAHVASLVGHVAAIVVVDNGSSPGAADTLGAIAAIPTVELVRNTTNTGIAHALNQAAHTAIARRAEWLLTLDQDAAPLADIVTIAAETYAAHPNRDRLAVIGSTSDTRCGPTRDTSPGRAWSGVSATVTAGSFVSVDGFERLGGYREELFVDYVDIEFCLRARAHGYRIAESRRAGMRHQIGHPAIRHLGRRTVTPTNHPALRRYYITRNRAVVWRKYWRTDGHYVARDILASQREIIKILAFEDDRSQKMRAVLAGLIDAWRDIDGLRAPLSAHPLPNSGRKRT